MINSRPLIYVMDGFWKILDGKETYARVTNVCP
ncbi:hypothetical protein FHR47_003081 [Xanthomonas arboricola]|nr:hypothetical protein [Xanthomonas cannabis]